MINKINSRLGLSNKSESIINDITAKLSAKSTTKSITQSSTINNSINGTNNTIGNISNSKKGKSKNLKSNDSNLNQELNQELNQNLSEFGKLMLHSDKKAMSSIQSELKAKTAKTNVQINNNTTIKEKPINEINNIIGELSNLFDAKPETKVQFSDAKTEEKFLDLIIENFEDLLHSDSDKISEAYAQAISNESVSEIEISENAINEEADFEFSSEYDILNPLSGLGISELKNLGIKVNNENPVNVINNNTKVSGVESFIQNELSSLDTKENTAITNNLSAKDLTISKTEAEINPYLINTTQSNLVEKSESQVNLKTDNNSNLNANTNPNIQSNQNIGEVESFIQNELSSLETKENIAIINKVVAKDLTISKTEAEINPYLVNTTQSNLVEKSATQVKLKSDYNSNLKANINPNIQSIQNIGDVESFIQNELSSIDNVAAKDLTISKNEAEINPYLINTTQSNLVEKSATQVNLKTDINSNLNTNINPNIQSNQNIGDVESFIQNELSSIDNVAAKDITISKTEAEINPYLINTTQSNLVEKSATQVNLTSDNHLNLNANINPNIQSNQNIGDVESFIQNELSSLDTKENIAIINKVVAKDLTISKTEAEINPYLVNITQSNLVEKSATQVKLKSDNNSNLNTNINPNIQSKQNIGDVESFIQNELTDIDNEEITITADSIKLIENNVINPEANLSNIKYKLKDLIGIIRQAMQTDVTEENETFANKLNKVFNKDINEPNYLKDTESRISSMVEKNTRNLVDNFLPKYFYKGINNLKNNSNSGVNSTNNLGKNATLNNISQDIFNTTKAPTKLENTYNFGEKIEVENIESYMTELNSLEAKLNPTKNIDNNQDKNIDKNDKTQTLAGLYNKSNISTKTDEKYNIEPSVEIEPIIETKANKITETIEEVKKKNDIKSENNLNSLVNLNQNNTEVKKTENIINRSNTLEFQTFNDIKTDELVETAAKATINTTAGNTSMVRITMNPTALGTVFVEIKMNGDNAELNFKASDKDVISILENNIAELQESLRKENVEIKSLIIDYKNFSDELNKDGQKNSQQNQANDNNQQQNKNNQNKSLYKDLQEVEFENTGIKLDRSFYDNLKNFAGSIREDSAIYKEVGKVGNNLETIKIKSKVIEKYL